ncbi:MAG: APC family permease [Deltaproteobacteria bacterium]|nr:APC family permease [Deltaproteobacteria bacterium]
MATENSTAHRTLGLADVLGIGINGIIGSGVYLLVGPLAARSGAASVFGVLACGILCGVIALCFAELASMFDRSGGPTIYAREAFGPLLGFAAGWFGAATGILGLAAVAVGFSGTLARVVPQIDLIPQGRTLMAVLVIVGFGALNLRGVKLGGRTSTVLSVVKVAPLVLLAIVGLARVPSSLLAQVFDTPQLAPGAEAITWTEGVARAAFLSVFMMSGFDYAAVPAGEVKEPRRTIPLALVFSLLGATALYVILQLTALATVPGLVLVQPAGTQHNHPLLDAAQVLFGPIGTPFIGVAALLSMLGYCAGVALVAPRYIVALSEDGVLSRRLRQRTRFGTPGAAIGVSTLIAAGLAILLGYTSLVDASNVVILSGYAGTALATLVLRLRKPDLPRRVKLPFGIVIPALAIGASLVLLWSAKPKATEWIFAGELLLIGAVVWIATALARRDAHSGDDLP